MLPGQQPCSGCVCSKLWWQAFTFSRKQVHDWVIMLQILYAASVLHHFLPRLVLKLWLSLLVVPCLMLLTSYHERLGFQATCLLLLIFLGVLCMSPFNIFCILYLVTSFICFLFYYIHMGNEYPLMQVRHPFKCIWQTATLQNNRKSLIWFLKKNT